jgi:hypothetical protein
VVFLCLLGAYGAKKKPLWAEAPAVFQESVELLQLDFFVSDMLASLGIKLHDLHFLGRCLFVLRRGVEVTCSSSGFQFDLLAGTFGCHDSSPN